MFNGMMDVGIASRPYVGQGVSGDAAGVIHHSSGTLLWVVDVLGHGCAAAQLCTAVVPVIAVNAPLAPIALMEILHHALRSTRGAAIGLMQIYEHTASWLGVGNISMTLWSYQLNHWRRKEGIERSGTVGHGLLTRLHVQKFTLTWDTWIYLHSDGILPMCQEEPPSLQRCQVIADGLLARFGLTQDDATILVTRITDDPRAERSEP